LPSSTTAKLLNRFVRRHGILIRSITGHDIIGVSDGEDPTLQGYFPALQTQGIAEAVPSFMVFQDPVSDRGHIVEGFSDAMSDLAVFSHLQALVFSE